VCVSLVLAGACSWSCFNDTGQKSNIWSRLHLRVSTFQNKFSPQPSSEAFELKKKMPQPTLLFLFEKLFDHEPCAPRSSRPLRSLRLPPGVHGFGPVSGFFLGGTCVLDFGHACVGGGASTCASSNHKKQKFTVQCTCTCTSNDCTGCDSSNAELPLRECHFEKISPLRGEKKDA
jgi:hypothetical protein